jgi:putative zinc finger/helix-turn-helix YgiT family protein
MQNNIISFPTAEPRRCAVCGDEHARVTYETESFPYGVGESQVTLSARVPVITCAACGSQLTDGSAEEIRHAEVCRHLGRLAPDSVRAIRERYGLSQHEWAERTGLGIASVKRWEAGNLIQNEAMDRYLRLLRNPNNFAEVSSWSSQSTEVTFRFQTKLPDAVFEVASSFVLRKSLS